MMQAYVLQKKPISTKPVITPKRPSLMRQHQRLGCDHFTTVQSLLRHQRIQPKIGISQPNDQYEREADRVADQVVSGINTGAVYQLNTIGNGAYAQRMCEDCEKELQLKPKQNTSPDSAANRTTEGGGLQLGVGQKLSTGERSFFESRMGHGFGDVRIHTNEQAAQSAEAINARAYTLGRDIVFNKGQYQPGTLDGNRLLAHELTHVIQQRNQANTIQRWSFGSGTPPHSDYSAVPRDERARVTAAMNIIEKVKNRPKDWPRCHKFYQDNCVGGAADTFKKKVDSATIWFDKDDSVWGSGVDPDHIGYSAETWRWGRWAIAGVMIHEMMHRCGQDNETINDKAITACGFPDIDKEKPVVKK